MGGAPRGGGGGWESNDLFCFFLESLVLCSSLCGYFTFFPILQQVRGRRQEKSVEGERKRNPNQFVSNADGKVPRRSEWVCLLGKTCENIHGTFMLIVHGFVQQAPESRSSLRDASDAVLAWGFPGGFAGPSLGWWAVSGFLSFTQGLTCLVV